VIRKAKESLARSESSGYPEGLLSRLAGLARAWLAQPALVAALAALAALLPPNVYGHAIIVSSHPAVGATLPQGELDVRLEFNSRIDRQRSRLVLHRPDGREAPLAPAADPPPNVLAGRAEATIAGRWRLDWQVLSVDGHITRGEVRFSVDEKAPVP
jgi:methionine-rich copper-binding protein CopC